MFLRVFSISLAMLALLTACVAQREDRGYTRSQADFSRIIPGTTSSKDVLELLGSPSSYSSYGDETWYYISARKETTAFLAPKITDQGAIAVIFDNKGVVKRVDEFTDAAKRDVAISNDKTPTEGNRITLMQQLLGNLGKFNTAGGGLPGQRSGGSGSPR